ncbi:MAG: flagellar biosynthesis protein FlgN [Synergistaceae bacterium]|nr:flagellar biosynthesis protein FlgN [Synergistaceae bacterium]
MRTELFYRVNKLVEEELTLYRDLENLVDIEEIKVRESDMEGLLDVLQQKQSVISLQETLLERWNQISSGLGIAEGREGPVFWNAVATSVGERGYNQIVGNIDKIRELGQNLLDREGRIRQNLEENLAEMRKTLLSMGRNRVAMKGYSQGVASSI